MNKLSPTGLLENKIADIINLTLHDVDQLKEID